MILALLLGCAGGARSFDGVDDHDVVGPLAGLDGEGLTVEAWVRPAEGGVAKQDIVARRAPGRRDSFLVRLRADLGGVLEFGVGGEGREWGAHTTARVPVGEWSFVAAAHDRRAGRVLLVVGERVEAFGPVTSPAATGADLVTWIGGDPALGPTERPFKGEIRAVWLWDHARSAAQIAADRTSAPAAGTPGLVLAWPPGPDHGIRIQNITMKP